MKCQNIVMNHWIERNVYPITIKTVKKRVRNEVETYLDLKKQIGRSKSKGWQLKAKSFTQNKDKLFDIFCENSDARGNLERKYQIPMLLEDFTNSSQLLGYYKTNSLKIMVLRKKCLNNQCFIFIHDKCIKI